MCSILFCGDFVPWILLYSCFMPTWAKYISIAARLAPWKDIDVLWCCVWILFQVFLVVEAIIPFFMGADRWSRRMETNRGNGIHYYASTAHCFRMSSRTSAHILVYSHLAATIAQASHCLSRRQCIISWLQETNCAGSANFLHFAFLVIRMLLVLDAGFERDIRLDLFWWTAVVGCRPRPALFNGHQRIMVSSKCSPDDHIYFCRFSIWMFVSSSSQHAIYQPLVLFSLFRDAQWGTSNFTGRSCCTLFSTIIIRILNISCYVLVLFIILYCYLFISSVSSIAVSSVSSSPLSPGPPSSRSKPVSVMVCCITNLSLTFSRPVPLSRLCLW